MVHYKEITSMNGALKNVPSLHSMGNVQLNISKGGDNGRSTGDQDNKGMNVVPTAI